MKSVRKIFVIAAVLFLLTIVSWSIFHTPGEVPWFFRNLRTPEEAPWLYASLIVETQPAQRVRAIQLATTWWVYDWRGNLIFGYSSDSLHPLQLHLGAFDEVTLYLESTSGKIELHFSDNFPPTYVTAVRWRAELVGGTQFDKWETVQVDGKTTHVSNDGYDYIYEVTAKWPQNDSRSSYVFRIISASE